MSRTQPLHFLVVPMLPAMLLALLLSGCSVSYYGQAALGQMRLSSATTPIEGLLADPDLDPELRARLELSQAALAFAHSELQLPDNGSYRAYADTGRSAVVWNVVATPEFSLQPLTWCFPIAGCVAYRGYFSPTSAAAFAARLQRRGNDVYVGPVAAYSTLGRLRDPVLNTMLPMAEATFVGLLFHELAHQRLYVKDDTRFNEGFASAVERIGQQRWFAQTGKPLPVSGAASAVAAVRELLRVYELRLQALYGRELSVDLMRQEKTLALSEFEQDYAQLTTALEAAPYSALVADGLNNAKLAALATYADWVPAFMQQYANCSAELECFYAQAEALAELPPADRTAALEQALSAQQNAR